MPPETCSDDSMVRAPVEARKEMACDKLTVIGVGAEVKGSRSRHQALWGRVKSAELPAYTRASRVRAETRLREGKWLRSSGSREAYVMLLLFVPSREMQQEVGRAVQCAL